MPINIKFLFNFRSTLHESMRIADSIILGLNFNFEFKFSNKYAMIGFSWFSS
jgi:hypothetical protein